MRRTWSRQTHMPRWCATPPLLLVLLVLAPPLEASMASSTFLAFEEEGLDLDTATKVPTGPAGLLLATQGAEADCWFAYHADRAPHAVLLHDASRGVEVAFLDGTPFDYVSDTDVPHLIFTRTPVDRSLDIDDTVVLRTDTGDLFKVGNAVEDARGVHFEYEKLLARTASTGPAMPPSAPHRNGTGEPRDRMADLPESLSTEDWRQIRSQVEQEGYEVVRLSSDPSRPMEPRFRASNRRHGLQVDFESAAVSVSSRGRAAASWRWGMALERWGYETAMHPARAAELFAVGNRLEYRRGDLVEWYVNDGRGLEQGFTLPAPPEQSGEGALVLELGLDGSLEAELIDEGRGVLLADERGVGVLRYAGLVAWDAKGRHLPVRMRLDEGRLLLAVDDQGATYPVTVDPTLTEEAKLTASDAAALDVFGHSVAIFGDTVVVGAIGDDDAGSQSGSAHVFVRTSTCWTEQAQLTASDAAAGDWFGYSVAIFGDTAVVGAKLDDDAGSQSGSAYVFVREGTVWTEEAKLTASDAAAADRFGRRVAISGDRAVVGARFDDDEGSQSGSAYVFVRTGAVWTEEAKLTASDAAAGDQFGVSVAISGQTVVVGAFLDDDGGTSSGSVYVFVRKGTTWNEEAKLTASDAAAGRGFGGSVAISGSTAAVGLGSTNAPHVYIFMRSARTWSEVAKVTSSDWAPGDFFGVSLAISGNTMTVGANNKDDAAGRLSGSAYVFVRSGTTWTEEAKLTATDAAAEDLFGSTVAIVGDTVVVGAPWDDDAGFQSGSAYVFDIPVDPATLLLALVDEVETVNLSGGIDQSLDAKLDAVLHALDDINQNNDVAAIHSLDAFIRSVEAQRGRQISDADADALIASAQAVIDLLLGS